MRVRLTLLAAALMLATGVAAAGALGLGTFEPPRDAPDFTLAGSNGAPVKLSQFRGKVVALGFGYTFCPDVCPTTLVDLAQVRKRLGPGAGDFQVLYVTVDPERDSPRQLREYLGAFDPTFLGASGAAGELAAVRKAYGIEISRKTYAGSRAAYLVHHSSFVYLIDRQGKLRAMIPFGASVEDVAEGVRMLMRK